MSSQFELKWVIEKMDADRQIKDFLKDEEISRTSLTDIK